METKDIKFHPTKYKVCEPPPGKANSAFPGITPVGTVVTIQSKYISGGNDAFLVTGQGGRWCYAWELEPCNITREELQIKKKALTDQLEEVCSQIAFMDELKLDEITNDEHRCYRALKIVESKSNDLERARELCKLFGLPTS